MVSNQTKLSSNSISHSHYKSFKVHGHGVDFVTIVAHQMRTPLTAIKWYIDLLLSGKAGDLQHEQRDYLLDIYQSNERMIRLVDNLLIIEQLEQNVLPIVKRSVSIASIVKSIVKEYETFAKVNEIAYIFHCEPNEVPQVNVDPIYMRLAIKNVIDNALRYTPKRGTVSISCEEQKNNQGTKSVLVSISDTGIGISPDEMDSVFRRFYRSPESMAMQTEGTGLGLYITKIIVEKNGGRVWFKSKSESALNRELKNAPVLGGEFKSQGTTFYIQLPVS